jgi:hypothetical protein
VLLPKKAAEKAEKAEATKSPKKKKAAAGKTPKKGAAATEE